jgi:hypothetical protein
LPAARVPLAVVRERLPYCPAPYLQGSCRFLRAGV